MARIMLVDSDVNILRDMKEYLLWYGFDVDALGDSSGVMERLEKGAYDMVICDIFVQPVDGYLLAQMIRKSQNADIAALVVMLTAPEEPELDRQLFLGRLGVNFMNKYGNAGVWNEKINILLNLQKRRGKVHEKI